MPKKARWLRLEENPDEEFDFFLAEKLGMHVEDVRTMPMDTWLDWAMYYQRKRQKQQQTLKHGR